MLRGESQFTDTNRLLLNGPNGHRPRDPKCKGASLLSLEDTCTNLGETKNENKDRSKRLPRDAKWGAHKDYKKRENQRK